MVTMPECTQWRANSCPAAFGLRPLVLVMGEEEVGATAVEVETLAEEVERHRRALDVPARAGPCPKASPTAGSPGFAAFHSAKSIGAALRLVDLDAGARGVAQVLDGAVRERAVPREGLDREVDTLVLHGVRVAAVDELLDELDHVVDVLGGVRSAVGLAHAELRHLVEVDGLVLCREVGLRAPLLRLRGR